MTEMQLLLPNGE